MSRSAGRVLIIPKGEYSATTTYEMLDAVSYQGAGYLCKKQSRGNVPTNTEYWQPNGSSGGGGDPSTYMLKDGSNAEILKFYENGSNIIQNFSFSKSAGENQTLNFQVDVKYNSTTGKLTNLIAEELKAYIGAELYFTDDTEYHNKIYFIIDSANMSSISYDTDDDVITGTAHLKTDTSEAMSFTNKSVSLTGYISEDVGRGIAFGSGVALGNNLSFAGGKDSTAGTRGFAFGDRCSAGAYAFAEGQSTSASLKGHAEGRYTSAMGEGTHAEGTGTIAQYNNQHAQGKWNMPRYGATFMIGNGTPSARSNCFEIYEDGSLSFDNGTTKFKFAKVSGEWGFYDKNGNFHKFYPVTTATKTVTLSTSDITETRISDSAITANSRLDWFIDKFGINPTNVEAGVGYCDFTFAKVDSATTIKISLDIK